MKSFHLTAILSITTGRALSPTYNESPMDGIYTILNYMTGRNLSTLGLPSAADECKPYLLQQHPFLKQITLEDIKITKEMYDMFIQELCTKYGMYHKIRPIHPEDHEELSDYEAAKRLGFKGEIIEFNPNEDDDISPTGDINWKAD